MQLEGFTGSRFVRSEVSGSVHLGRPVLRLLKLPWIVFIQKPLRYFVDGGATIRTDENRTEGMSFHEWKTGYGGRKLYETANVAGNSGQLVCPFTDVFYAWVPS